MEPSDACDDAFHERFKYMTFQDDIGIHIWRESWNAAIDHVLKLIEGEKNER